MDTMPHDPHDESRTVGRRAREIRESRGKSLRVICGLAGLSLTTLWRIEQGLHAPTLTEIVKLAGALEVAPSELTRLPIPAPANGHTDATTEAVRLALDAVENDQPDGLALPLAALRDQVARLHRQHRACQFADVATELPALIRNLHTSLATGTDHAELLDLAVYLHVHITRIWLTAAAAPTDLVRRAAFLAQRLARERDDLTTLAVAGFGVADTLLSGGAFPQAQAKLDSITLPPTAARISGFLGLVTASHAIAAALDSRPGEMAAPMEAAAELAERFGEAAENDSLGFVFGPTSAATHRIWLALETGEPDQAVRIGQDAHPERAPFAVNQAYYWVHYGRSLARLRERRDDAVMALRTAEDIFPTKVRRDPLVRETIATLLPGAGRDAISVELRAMAYRTGLPV